MDVMQVHGLTACDCGKGGEPKRKGADALPLGPSPGRKRPNWAAMIEAGFEESRYLYEPVRGAGQAMLSTLVKFAQHCVATAQQCRKACIEDGIGYPDKPLKS